MKRVHNNTAYGLDPPPEMSRIFPVYHPWLLHIDPQDSLSGQDEHEPGLVKVYQDKYGDTAEDYEVTSTVNPKIDKTLQDKLTGQRGLLKSRRNPTLPSPVFWPEEWLIRFVRERMYLSSAYF